MGEGIDPRAATIASIPSPGLGDFKIHSTLTAEDPVVLANRYELRGMLGSGGMGTVYLAHDRELDEDVALKVLRKELASSEEMLGRFRREVKLARRVTHRNVARTFDIGEHAGDRYLTMEYIEGEMLGTYLARHGQLSVGEVARLGCDLCSGLAAAHAADVIHRDLKLENVIVARDGRAVITDFGIARAAEEGRARTAAGFIGTPAYMAPEQVEGAQDLDARADLYALGVIFYELLTGTDAWPGDSVIAVAAARLLRPPPDPRQVVPDLPEAASRLVLKLMARRREDRCASADEARRVLEGLLVTRAPQTLRASELPRASAGPGPAGVRVHVKTVAVLPFANHSSADDAYVGDALNEEIVDALSAVPELRVRPRGHAARAVTRDVREAGRTLGVDVIVDGSIRRAGDVLRVSVRLVTVADGFQLWARRFDGAPSDIFTIAETAAKAIARALATEVSVPERRANAVSNEAQELFLRGRYLLHRAWHEVNREAATMLREAHQRAPDDPRIGGVYAMALARWFGNATGGSDIDRETRTVANHVLSIEPSQPEARAALGMLDLHESDGESAARELARALALVPNNVDALDAVGKILIEIGRPDEGIARLREAVAIEPDLENARFSIARAQFLLGDRESADELLVHRPDHPADLVPYFFMRTRLAMWAKDMEAARRLRADLETVSLAYARRSVEGLLGVVLRGALLDDDRAQLQTMIPLNAAGPKRRAAFNGQLRAEILLHVGDVDGALEALESSDAHGLFDFLWLEHCPILAPLRANPTFARVHASTANRAARIASVLQTSHNG